MKLLLQAFYYLKFSISTRRPLAINYKTPVTNVVKHMILCKVNPVRTNSMADALLTSIALDATVRLCFICIKPRSTWLWTCSGEQRTVKAYRTVFAWHASFRGIKSSATRYWGLTLYSTPREGMIGTLLKWYLGSDTIQDKGTLHWNAKFIAVTHNLHMSTRMPVFSFFPHKFLHNIVRCVSAIIKDACSYWKIWNVLRNFDFCNINFMFSLLCKSTLQIHFMNSSLKKTCHVLSSF